MFNAVHTITDIQVGFSLPTCQIPKMCEYDQENDTITDCKTTHGIYYILKVIVIKILSECDQEIPQSQTAGKPRTPRVRATQQPRDTSKTNQANQPSLTSSSK